MEKAWRDPPKDGLGEALDVQPWAGVLVLILLYAFEVFAQPTAVTTEGLP
jgi:hypothetical protein